MFLRTAAAVGSTLPPRSGVSDLNFPSPAPDLRSLFIERDSLTAMIYFVSLDFAAFLAAGFFGPSTVCGIKVVKGFIGVLSFKGFLPMAGS